MRGRRRQKIEELTWCSLLAAWYAAVSGRMGVLEGAVVLVTSSLLGLIGIFSFPKCPITACQAKFQIWYF